MSLFVVYVYSSPVFTDRFPETVKENLHFRKNGVGFQEQTTHQHWGYQPQQEEQHMLMLAKEGLLPHCSSLIALSSCRASPLHFLSLPLFTTGNIHGDRTQRLGSGKQTFGFLKWLAHSDGCPCLSGLVCIESFMCEVVAYSRNAGSYTMKIVCYKESYELHGEDSLLQEILTKLVLVHLSIINPQITMVFSCIILLTCKDSVPYSQLLRLRRIC